MSAIHVVGVVVLIAIVAGVQIAVHRYSVRKRREATAGFWTRIYSMCSNERTIRPRQGFVPGRALIAPKNRRAPTGGYSYLAASWSGPVRLSAASRSVVNNDETVRN